MTTTVKDMLAAANAAVPRITGAEAQALAGQPNVVLLDIRDGSEVAVSGKAKGASIKAEKICIQRLAVITPTRPTMRRASST